MVLGKIDVPLGPQDLQSFNQIYGTTVSPWDYDRTPGGSSGGSAAALAAGFGALSLGSDIAGSLRTPAHFCGVYAHKPTLGLAANRGMVPPTTPALPVDLDLAVVGPMARTARDVERHSPLLPDLAEAATLYTQLLFSGSVARFPVHRHGWRQLFTEFDAVVCPITPTPAFPHDHDPDLLERRIDIDGVDYPFFDQPVWAGPATMPGLPATAVPAGRLSDGLPVGVQLIGPMFEDRTSLRLAELLEQKIGGFQAPR